MARALRHKVASRSTLFDALVVLAVLLVVGGPALFTSDGFAADFTNHLWLVWVQQHAIEHGLVPTFFINAPTQGAFDPFFAFYGGTLYAAAGALAVLLLGHVVVAYVAVILLAVAAAYGGFLWLARQVGARSWMAHAPAVAFVSSAYYITNLYGRGDWPELVASSSIPLLVASGWRLARAPRIEPWCAVLFVVSVIVFSGSHNATLLWGSIALAVTWLSLRLALGSRLAPSSLRRASAMAGLAILALAVNAWFLVPDVLHGGDTQIARDHIAWSASAWINTPGVLFDPLRYVPRQSTTPALFVQAPTWFLLWALVCAAVMRRSAARELRRAFLALVAVLLGFLGLILLRPLYDLMPLILQSIQLPYRLSTFVAMAVAGLVLVAVLAVERARAAGTTPLARHLEIGLGFAVAVSVGLCLWQMWIPATHTIGSYADRSEALVSVHATPRSWYAGGGSYADLSAPVVYAAPSRLAMIDAKRIESEHVTLTLTPPPGLAPFATNIVGGAYLVAVRGVTRMGRTPDGRVVVRREHAGSGSIRLTIEPSGAARIARLVSLAALVTLLGLLVRVALRPIYPRARGGLGGR